MLRFDIFEGKNKNYFLQKKNLNLHLLITENTDSSDPARIFFLFPENNSGVGLLLSTDDETKPGFKISMKGEVESAEFPKKVYGASVKLSFNAKKITFSSICMDSIRAIRDLKYTEAFNEREQTKYDFFTQNRLKQYIKPQIKIAKHKITLRQKGCDFKNEYYLKIIANPKSKISLDGNNLTIKSGDDLQLKFYVSYTGKRLIPCKKNEILNSSSLSFLDSLKDNDKAKFNNSLRTFRFLAYRQKIITGSWSFLTYFGRDTLITGMLLKNTVSEDIYKTILQGVIDRMSDTGMVAHEEDVGDQAGYRHICDFNPARDKFRKKLFSEPVYDYKMIDDDFLFSIALDKFLGDQSIPEKRKISFLKKNNARGEKNMESILRNFEFVLRTTDEEHLIRIKHPHVGNWRDSNIGLGQGKYPLDVNAFLVPAALKSISDMTAMSSFRNLEISEKCPFVRKYIENRKLFPGLIKGWNLQKNKFLVDLSPDELRIKLDCFLGQLPDKGEKELALKSTIDGITLSEFIYDGKLPDKLKNGLQFYSLSLDENFAPVKVVNSDIVFSLFMAAPEKDELEIMLNTLELNYPLGICSDIGVLSANPAFSDNRELWRKLDRKAYHGSVVWAWQHYMAEMGLMKQIRRFSGDERDFSLVSRMQSLLKKYHDALQVSEKFLNSELWSYKVKEGTMTASAYGEEKGSQTESNAVQLWSSTLMSVMKEFSEMSTGTRKS